MIRRLTDREYTKLQRLVRSGARQSASPPIRGTTKRRVRHMLQLEAQVGRTQTFIPSFGSGSVALVRGPHPFTNTTTTITAFNYSPNLIENSTIVLLVWVELSRTNGFWLACGCPQT